jgi:hypothetical protein
MKKLQIYDDKRYNDRKGSNGYKLVVDDSLRDGYSIYSEMKEVEYINSVEKLEVTVNENPYRDAYLNQGKGRHYINLGKVMRNEVKYGLFVRK